MNSVTKIITKEQAVINSAINNGHLNPRNNAKQNACLYADGADRKITDFIQIDPSKVVTNNPRFNDIDVGYCKSELAPLLQRKFKQSPDSLGLEYPIFVVKRGSNWEIVHGHNRYWCLVHILKVQEIPIFVIEDKGTPMQKLFGRIVPNIKKADHNREYTMNCVVEQLKLAKQTGYFTNLTDEEKTRQEFVLFMNKFHPDQFLDNSIRGKIFKGFYTNSGSKSTSIIPVNPSFWDSCFSRLGYPSRHYTKQNGKSAETQFPYYVCNQKKAIILYAPDNKQLLEMHLWKFINLWNNDPNYRNSHSGYTIHLFSSFRKVNPTVTEMLTKRIDDRNKVNKWNKTLSAIKGCPKISTLVYPMQLTIETKDTIFKLNKSGKLV